MHDQLVKKKRIWIIEGCFQKKKKKVIVSKKKKKSYVYVHMSAKGNVKNKMWLLVEYGEFSKCSKYGISVWYNGKLLVVIMFQNSLALKFPIKPTPKA